MKVSSIVKGDMFVNKQGQTCIAKSDCKNNMVTVMFLDTGTIKDFRRDSLLNGVFKDPYFPRVYGVGFKGEGPAVAYRNGKDTESYKKWVGALERSYSSRYHKFGSSSYEDCSVDPFWHNFNNYDMWHKEQPKFESRYHLDKDLLIPKNKVYSQETCCLIPEEINLALSSGKRRTNNLKVGVGKSRSGKFIARINVNNKPKTLGNFESENEAYEVYKAHKEAHIKTLAKKWERELPSQVFDKLSNWNVDLYL